MSIPTSVWFIIAAVALVLGLLMLRASQRAGGAQPRDRRRWAEQKEWEYLDSDPVLPSRWRYGTIHQGGPGVARNLVTGSVPTPEGRRLIYVFDHEQAGRISSVVCAVQRRSSMKGAFELRLPSAPLPDDAGLDLLEPVGERYAFVSDATAIRPLITPRLARSADAIGEDVELLWGEDSWVLCTAPLDYTAEQLQHLLDQLVEVAGALEEASRSSRPTSAPPVSPVGGATTAGGGSAADSAGGPSAAEPTDAAGPSGTDESATAEEPSPSAKPAGGSSAAPASDPTAPGPLGGVSGPGSSGTGSGAAGSGSAAAGWVRSLSNRATELHSVDQGKKPPTSDVEDMDAELDKELGLDFDDESDRPSDNGPRR